MQESKSHTVQSISNDAENFVFLENQVLDSLVSTVMELSAEVWSLKRRALITESLLQASGPLAREAVETYVPTVEEEADWRAQRDRFIKRIYAPFARQAPLNRAAGPEAFIQR